MFVLSGNAALVLCDPRALAPAERQARRAFIARLDRLTARFASAVMATTVVAFAAQFIRWGLA